MRQAAAEFARNVVRVLYPKSCLICDAPEGGGAEPFWHELCIECYHFVTRDPFPACPRCAQTIGPHTGTEHGCAECRGVALGFDRAIRLGPYAGRLRDAVLRTKRLTGEGLADLLGRAFVECHRPALEEADVDLVAPVPLHWWRKWTRGYNQSDALARELAAGLNVPLVPRLLRRVKWTTQQVQPTRAARRENVKGAFRASRGARLGAKTVLLVDDVMTTGSTLGEAARALRDAGADRVVVAVAARK